MPEWTVNTHTWYTDISSWNENADVEERARADGVVLNKSFQWAEQLCIDVDAMHGLALVLHNHEPPCILIQEQFELIEKRNSDHAARSQNTAEAASSSKFTSTRIEAAAPAHYSPPTVSMQN